MCYLFVIVVSNIVSKCVIIHAILQASLFQNDLCSSKYRQKSQFTVFLLFFFLFSSKSFQIPSKCTIKRPCFQFFSEVTNRFQTVRKHDFRTCFQFFLSEVPYRIRCRQNATFNVLAFKIVSAVPNRFRMHPLLPLFIFFL